MSSGDPLVFFPSFQFSYLASQLFSFFLFFHQILNCLLYLLVRFFFLFVFFSISLVFFIPRVIVLIIHYLFSYICQLSAIKITIYHALRR